MRPLLGKLHTLLTLSSPHLGFLYGSSLIDTGIYMLKKWRKVVTLEQLAFTDNVDVKETFLYKLSKERGLEYFKHVILCSAHQDKYCPFHSARIEKCSAALKDARFGQYHCEMVENLISPLDPARLLRVDINYKLGKTSFDTVIGRAAHIRFLDNIPVTMQLLYCYRQLFE